ncbi:transmembrane protein [Cystoisospora suis]|uniref:Transmembrane protein n=1 Tax=Cystoisospora suis TaxID=483139 RepID=A0A2C6L9W0_9APIC|nr:transmembrane protein [Cystoisospora suis]
MIAEPQTTAAAPPRAASSPHVCGWMFKSEGWLRFSIGLQALVGLARLLTPRPLVSVANFFLVFLGFNVTATPAVIRLFFLAFFSLILGLSDLFWLVMKFTGPFGSAWLDPQFYWRPLYPSVYDHAYLTPPPPVAGDSPGAAAKPVTPVPLSKMYPPERPPAVWQIYVELVCFCVSPLVSFLTAWLAWRIYKRSMAEIQSAEVGFFLSPGESDYGATGAATSPAGFYTPARSPAVVGEGEPLLHPSRGTNAFIPFAGEGIRLGGDAAGAGAGPGRNGCPK